MSSYNSIVKIKYADNLSEAVSLQEYVIMEDAKKKRKFIVFKFSNNVNQHLFGMKFEVSQYDSGNELIEKSVVVYNKFDANPNSTFVPKARLKVRFACKRISVRLVQAAFDRVLWNEGSYVDNSYKFEHYVRDEKYIEEKDRPVKKQPKPAKEKKGKEREVRFRVKNITKKNIAKGPAVFYWIFCILIVGAIAASLVLFRRQSKIFTLQGYDLQIIEGANVRIVGYEGDEDNIVIPSVIDNYTVTRIGKDAFTRLPATSVTLPSSLSVIETGAFHHMTNLDTVLMKDDTSVTVQVKAFDSCLALRKFEVRGAEMAVNSLYGCTNVSDIRFFHTSAERLLDLFGETKHAVKITRFMGTYDNTEKDFFESLEPEMVLG